MRWWTIVSLLSLVAGCAESHVVDDGVVRACDFDRLFEIAHGDASAVVTLRTDVDCQFADTCEFVVSTGGMRVGCRGVACVDGHPQRAECADAGP